MITDLSLRFGRFMTVYSTVIVPSGRCRYRTVKNMGGIARELLIGAVFGGDANRIAQWVSDRLEARAIAPPTSRTVAPIAKTPRFITPVAGRSVAETSNKPASAKVRPSASNEQS